MRAFVSFLTEPVTPEARSVAERYRILQKAGGLVAPLLTVLLAFFISGIVVLLTDRERR